VVATSRGATLSKLDRLVVSGPEARLHAASLTAAVHHAVPSLPVDYIHADEPLRFGLAPVLEDLARTSDATTARFAQRRMEFRSTDVRLTGDSLPWMTLAVAFGLGTAGLLIAMTVARLVLRRPTVPARFADRASAAEVAA
jgi:hypothetical protein